MPHTTYSRSPVIEMALGMEFVAGSFKAGQALEIRDQLRGQYPRVELLDALPPQPPLGLSGSFVGLSVGGPPNRWWFISEDDSHLVQLQHDRLLLNWRKSTNTEYPRHHNLMPLFLDVLTVVNDVLGGIAPLSIETDYYNLDAGLPDRAGLASLLIGAGELPEQLLGENMAHLEISERGRLGDRSAQWTLSARREAGGPAQFHIATRADATGLPLSETGELPKAFESLHELAILAFERHTTDAARERWI